MSEDAYFLAGLISHLIIDDNKIKLSHLMLVESIFTSDMRY